MNSVDVDVVIPVKVENPAALNRFTNNPVKNVVTPTKVETPVTYTEDEVIIPSVFTPTPLTLPVKLPKNPSCAEYEKPFFSRTDVGRS